MNKDSPDSVCKLFLTTYWQFDISYLFAITLVNINYLWITYNSCLTSIIHAPQITTYHNYMSEFTCLNSSSPIPIMYKMTIHSHPVTSCHLLMVFNSDSTRWVKMTRNAIYIIWNNLNLSDNVSIVMPRIIAQFIIIMIMNMMSCIIEQYQ